MSNLCETQQVRQFCWKFMLKLYLLLAPAHSHATIARTLFGVFETKCKQNLQIQRCFAIRFIIQFISRGRGHLKAVAVGAPPVDFQLIYTRSRTHGGALSVRDVLEVATVRI